MAPHVCIIGSGCTGLAAAHVLCKAGVRVTVLEASSHVGGHAHTLEVEGVPVDVGFMVCNRVTYPNMVSGRRRASLRRARAPAPASAHSLSPAGVVRGAGRGGGRQRHVLLCVQAGRCKRA